MKYENGVVTLHPFGGGMNNRAQKASIPENFVRNAVNADFANDGSIRQRGGMVKTLACIAPKGGYSCPLGRYFVEGPKLKQFNGSSPAAVLYSGIIGTTFTYDYFNDTVYFSDGVIALKITATTVTKWGMTPPAAPVLSTTAGAYGAGQYLAFCVWVDATGVESGPSPVVSIDAPASCGIVFGNLPHIVDSQAVALRLYLSMPNGNELFHVADTTSSSYTIAAGTYDNSTVFDGYFISPPPAGRIIRLYNARAYVADALGTIWYSEPYSFDQFRLGSNFLQFPEVVDIMEPVADGLFIAYGDRTEFWAGTPEDGFTVTKKFDYGGVFGTGKRVPNSSNVAWQSQRGLVIGAPGGECKNVQEANVAVETAVSGATLIREQDGIRQFIASLQQPTTSTLAASSWITAELVRRAE